MENDVIEKLKKIRQKDKFSVTEWNKRGLNPSSTDLCIKMETLLNGCIDELMDCNFKDKKNSKKVLKNGLLKFNKLDYDTEEKEFIADYFCELADIMKLDFKNDLNSWLYGSILNSLFKLSNLFRKSEKVQNTISQNCEKCKSKLETFIIETNADIDYESYSIVKCKNCGEFNLIDFGKGVEKVRFGYYEVVENLNKEDFSKEQAVIRLEQIRHFRQ